MPTGDRHRVDLMSRHDEIVSEARFTLHQAVACLQIPRSSPRARRATCRDTAELVAVALELLHRAQLSVVDMDGPSP